MNKTMTSCVAGLPSRLPIKPVTVRSAGLAKSRAPAWSARLPALAQLAGTVLAEPDGLKAQVICDITVNGAALPASSFF